MKTRRFPLLLVALFCAFALAVASFAFLRPPTMAPTDDSPRIAPSAAREVRGEVVFRSLNEQYARVKEEGREWKVIMNPNSTVVETWGPQDQAMSFADVIPGAEVIAEGTAEGTTPSPGILLPSIPKFEQL